MDPLFSESMQVWFEWVLLWIGFGTCVGLLAKALMPGRDPGGPVATLLMGITGVAIGCGVYSLIYGERVRPISSVGLLCGTLGAFTILFFYRILGGIGLEGNERSRDRRSAALHLAPRRTRRRRYRSYYVDDPL
jgi:uncharacterized membrane protein YeaQ/YmgE (transglycosylase-associated protein family)